MSIYLQAWILYKLSLMNSIAKNITKNYNHPWPPIKKIIKIIKIKVIYLIRKLFKRKTCKRIIHPEQFKSWKGGRK